MSVSVDFPRLLLDWSFWFSWFCCLRVAVAFDVSVDFNTVISQKRSLPEAVPETCWLSLSSDTLWTWLDFVHIGACMDLCLLFGVGLSLLALFPISRSVDPACGFGWFDYWLDFLPIGRSSSWLHVVGTLRDSTIGWSRKTNQFEWAHLVLLWCEFTLVPWSLVGFWCLGFWHKETVRFGEADNPGPIDGSDGAPSQLFTGANFAISCCNPSGVAGKEAVLLGIPPGIINVAETHLSSIGLQQSLGNLRRLAASCSRRLRLIPGAPVALRPHSLTTGTWSGVLQMADCGCHRLDLPWPNREFSLGRALVSKFFIGSFAVLGTTLYGWPSSPSWPQGRQATLDLLTHLTEQVVVGSSGPRFITGDFNGDESHYAILAHWQTFGRIELQSLHASLTQELPRPTYQHKTQPDRMYLSPELAQLFVRCSLRDDFAGHSTLVGVPYASHFV